MNGLKYDDGKPMPDLIPPDAVMAIGHVLTYGAQKYGPNNWQGVESNRYVARSGKWYAAFVARCNKRRLSGGAGRGGMRRGTLP